MSAFATSLLDGATSAETGATNRAPSNGRVHLYQIAGTFVGTVIIQLSFDGLNWFDEVSSTIPTVGEMTATPYVRAKVSSYTSGTITVYMKPTN